MTLLQGYIVFMVVVFIIFIWSVIMAQETDDHE